MSQRLTRLEKLAELRARMTRKPSRTRTPYYTGKGIHIRRSRSGNGRVDFLATISAAGEQWLLGSFPTFGEAVDAYERAYAAAYGRAPEVGCY